MIRAAILGGTGYGGMELLRLLLGHPDVEVLALTSRSDEGAVGERHPHLRGFTDLRFTLETEGPSFFDPDKTASYRDHLQLIGPDEKATHSFAFNLRTLQ